METMRKKSNSSNSIISSVSRCRIKLAGLFFNYKTLPSFRRILLHSSLPRSRMVGHTTGMVPVRTGFSSWIIGWEKNEQQTGQSRKSLLHWKTSGTNPRKSQPLWNLKHCVQVFLIGIFLLGNVLWFSKTGDFFFCMFASHCCHYLTCFYPFWILNLF